MFGDGGANINFVRYNKAGHISLRTYERGVETRPGRAVLVL